jgi:AcrR family transcriptional regulator
LRRALLVATLEVLRETGYDKLTIDQVVARVHASKATVYRRWSNKAELVCAAFAYSIRAEAPMPDTGTLRGDLLAMAEIIAGDAYQYGRIVAGILGAGERNPQLRELLVEDLHSYVPADLAVFMADSQVPWGVDALGGPVTDPAWRYKPSWYLVTTEDRMIFPAAQRTMSQRAGSTVVEVAASHSVYVSQPAPVTELIKQAVSAVAAQQ